MAKDLKTYIAPGLFAATPLIDPFKYLLRSGGREHVRAPASVRSDALALLRAADRGDFPVERADVSLIPKDAGGHRPLNIMPLLCRRWVRRRAKQPADCRSMVLRPSAAPIVRRWPVRRATHWTGPALVRGPVTWTVGVSRGVSHRLLLEVASRVSPPLRNLGVGSVIARLLHILGAAWIVILTLDLWRPWQ